MRTVSVLVALVYVLFMAPAIGSRASAQCPGGVCPSPSIQGVPFPSFYESTYPSFPGPLAGVREFRDPVFQQQGAIPYVIFCPCVQQAQAVAPTYYQPQFQQQQQFYAPAQQAYGPQQRYYYQRPQRGVRVSVGVQRR
jgi:hypothetical protein